MTDNKDLISFSNVSFTYEAPTRFGFTKKDKFIIDDLSLHIKKGDFYFLTGLSGSGKTTFIKLIFKGLIPISGSIKVFNKDLSALRYKELPLFRRKIGMVLHSAKLMDHMTLLENVALPLTIAGTPLQQAHECAKEILNWVGLWECLSYYPASLSDGQKQRGVIARAVITNPYLLLADEPTANVDETHAYKIMHLFEELNRNGTTIILATHHRQLIDCYQHPELYLHRGKLIQGGEHNDYTI